MTSPQQAYGGLLFYECPAGHTVVLNDEWPDALTRSCPHRSKPESPPCSEPSKLKILKSATSTKKKE